MSVPYGPYGRADIAGLNLAQYPPILIELGNMRNAGEAAHMESTDARPNTWHGVVAQRFTMPGRNEVVIAMSAR